MASRGTHHVCDVAKTRTLTSALGLSSLARNWCFQGRGLGRLTTIPNMPRSNVMGAYPITSRGGIMGRGQQLFLSKFYWLSHPYSIDTLKSFTVFLAEVSNSPGILP